MSTEDHGREYDHSQERALPSQHEQAQGDAERYSARGSDGDQPRLDAPARVEQGGEVEGLHSRGLGERGRESDSVVQPSPDQQPFESLELRFEQSFQHSGPMPHPSLLADYEQIVPGAAERMLAMAERSQEAQIDGELIPVKAEARAFMMATFSVSFFPWIALLVGAGLLMAGYEAAGIAAGSVGLLSAGPQIISATKRSSGGSRKK